MRIRVVIATVFDAVSRLRSLSTLLLVSPAVLGKLYLFLIPFYAAIYSLFADEFLTSTVKYDPRWRLAEREIEATLDQQNGTCLQRFGVVTPINVDGSLGTVAFGFFQPGGSQVQVEIGVPIVNPDVAGGFPLLYGTEEISIFDYAFGTSYSEPTINRSVAFIRLTPAVEHEVKFTYKALKASLDCFGGFASFGTMIDFDNPVRVALPTTFIEPIEELTRSFVYGGQIGYGGKFIRFTYFSVVTITTLGFGDILPITDRMRLLVASQSIIGIVLMGLFLNAIARARVR